MLQIQLIERVREICRADERLVAALMYGSFSQGSGDQYSDIEFVLFFRDDVLATLDRRTWLEQIAPVELHYINHFGIDVAVFDSLVRGEFHFDPISEVAVVSTWKDTDWSISLESCLIADKTGELTPHLQQLVSEPTQLDRTVNLQTIINDLINMMIFGLNVYQRGEYARALDLIGAIHRDLLWMARLSEGATANWPTPFRKLEQDISTSTYHRYQTCTTTLDPDNIRQAYRNAWVWAMEILTELRPRITIDVSELLLQKITDWVDSDLQ